MDLAYRYTVSMKLARFWARESHSGTVARGWSDESLHDAREAARQTARRIAEKFASGDFEKKQYLYGDRPLPEPVVQEFPGAVVTRNVYGALILNTSSLMFVDIDREGDQAGASIVRAVEQSGLAARVYRTAAGHRVLLTNASFEAGSPTSEQWLQHFGADALYTRLCRLQQSFRARLTPKPWRCNLGMPPVTFPFETPNAEAHFSQWLRRYNAAAQGYATCRLVHETGAAHPGFAGLIGYHDQETKATSGLPLA
jgi:hypothetical protein